MRKAFLFVFALATLGLTSCGQDEENVQQKENKVVKNDLSAKFKAYIQSKIGDKKTSRVIDSTIYDTDNVYYNKEVDAYYFLQRDFNFDSKEEQMAIFAVPDDQGNFGGILETGMSKVDDENFTVKYYDGEELINSVDYVLNKQEGRIYFRNVQDLSTSGTTSRGCGQAVANCIAGTYVNHGWMSVTLWVETAFIPQTSIAVTAACAIKNCSL
ncbi:hypothetical protein ACNFU2_07960 [Chryseobacterium sp. PTM-20240506]|uniref:hypothetical protein n=1 Tax=unclassified Chryseobacterium TaxID=2593645 RepID=UPI0015519D74|nr:hypothetical protein [Chryseobacterium sp. LAM-KRS1]